MTHFQKLFSRTALIGAASAVVLLAACSNPVKPDGVDAVRADLTALQSDPKLAVLAPVAIQEAEAAVRAAEVPTEDAAAGQQAVYLAQGKVAVARAQAERRLAEDAVKSLGEQRGEIRLDARTREAELAKAQAEAAAAAALQQQQAAAAAMAEANKAKAEAEDLKRQMADLEAKATDRGLVMTLGDVLFSTGQADLKPGAAERLNKLAAFMLKYPDRGVVIEGHTDSTGSAATNQALSERRANAVKAYLISQGVPAASITTIGKGKDVPVADNTTASGRQANRRVEIIIANVMASK